MRTLACWAVVVTACGSPAPAPAPATTPPPPATDERAPIPAEPQRSGDARRGWDALVTEGYVGCGVPRSLWDRFGGATRASHELERSRGADLPYFMNLARLPSGAEVVTANCLGCHAAFLRGKLVVGLGEASADFTTEVSDELALAGLLVGAADRSELAKLVGRLRALAPHVRMRTVGANPADHIAAVLFAHRDPKTLAWSEAPLIPLPAGDPIPTDVPAWWLMKRKTAMFYTGAGRGDQARIMMTASVLCVDDVATARQIDAYFPDIRAFILSLEPPPYPAAIDAALAARGKQRFEATCAKCHGSYGPGGSYQTRVIPLAKIGTDPLLAQHAGQFSKPFTSWFNGSFYGERARLDPGNGYVAPPLDGVWATAPYLHNGSIPNLAALLDSTRRLPRAQIVRHGDAYDLREVGWPNRPAGPEVVRAWVYDTSQPGYSNAGHTFGDRLSPDERAAVIEYLKTL
jgi:mono/diheme cytochrome c family protein